MPEQADPAPRAFISYAWSPPEHVEKVLRLAERLVADGIDVTIDKWDLKTGHDANAFMERIVTDPSVGKVIIISNRVYVEKANARAGGAGIEAQIMSPEIYKSVDQNKFALVAFELDPEGKPYVPAFYGSRIYINLAADVGYEEEYDQLLRWAYGKPLHKKPVLGKTPAHLFAEETSAAGTRAAFLRALDFIRQGRPAASQALGAFRDEVLQELSKHVLVSEGANDFDDRIVEDIESLRPIINQIQDLIFEICRSENAKNLIVRIIDLLEGMVILASRPNEISQWHEWDFDNFRFVSHEALLVVCAVCIKEKRYDLISEVLSHRYVNPRSRSGSQFTFDFSIFYGHMRSLEHRNARLAKNRFSLRADMVASHFQGSILSIDEISSVDLILFLRDASTALSMEGHMPGWYPLTLIFIEDRSRPLEIFARAESRAVFNSIVSLLGVESVEQFKLLIERIIANKWSPRTSFFGINLKGMTNIDRIAIYP